MWQQYLRAQFARAARRSLRPIGLLDYSVIYRWDLARPLAPFRARLPIEICIATDEQLDVIAEITGSPFHCASLLRARTRTGSKCFLASLNGEIAGFNWVTRGQVHDEFYRISLNPKDVYCMDAHTIESYRGNAIHTELLFRLLEYAKGNGCRYAYTRVSAMNVASWKSHLRLGWEELGRTYVLQPHDPSSRCRLFGPAIYPVEPNLNYTVR